MKRSTIDTAAGILSGIKLNRIPDKSIKMTLFNDYLNLRKFAKESADSVKEISDKFNADWGKEQDEVKKLTRHHKPLTGYEEFLAAKEDAEALIDSILNEDVDVEITSVPFDDFMSMTSDEDLTLEHIAFLKEIGIVQ